MGPLDEMKKTEGRGRMDILSIPCDYDGYDMVFEEGTTDPQVYIRINELVTNGNFDIRSIDEYERFCDNLGEEDFDEFYDMWIESLLEKGFAAILNNEVGIVEFLDEVDRILYSIGSGKKIDPEAISKKYYEELQNYSFKGAPIIGNFNYEVLETNVAAEALREIGYELICFFNGFDNDIKALIPIEKIDELKQLEASIK